MNHGIYTITSGALATEKRFQIVANNLANVNTTGFKKQNIAFSSMLPLDDSKSEKKEFYPESIKKGVFNTYPFTDITQTDFSQGSLKHTGNTFDFAISGKGFFMLKDAKGNIKFSRNGTFKVNKDGFLVNSNGEQVLDPDYNPIRLNLNGIKFVNVDEKGNIYLENTFAAKIAVMDFEDKTVLERIGYTEFQVRKNLTPRPVPRESEEYEILQGYLEESNVNLIKEMTAMIEVQRHYQVTQKVITTIDTQLDAKAVNDVGRL